MTGRITDLKKRLDRAERELADRAWHANFNGLCNCREETDANPLRPQDFEEEMNTPCPAHGFRRLGKITHFTFLNEDGTAKPHPKLDPLIKSYYARLDQANREVTHAPHI
ncbi:MAG: hypothetical protein ACLP0H_20090 [Terriglobales bacterium]